MEDSSRQLRRLVITNPACCGRTGLALYVAWSPDGGREGCSYMSGTARVDVWSILAHASRLQSLRTQAGLGVSGSVASPTPRPPPRSTILVHSKGSPCRRPRPRRDCAVGWYRVGAELMIASFWPFSRWRSTPRGSRDSPGFHAAAAETEGSGWLLFLSAVPKIFMSWL